MKQLHLILSMSLAAVAAPPVLAAPDHMAGAQAAQAAQAAAQAPTLERIRARGYLVVGNEFKFPTMNVLDAATGRNEGFMADLARSLARHLLGDEGKVEFRHTEDASRLDDVVNGRVDMLIDTTGGIADNAAQLDAKKKLVDFSDETFRSGSALLVRKDGPVRGLDDIGDGTRVLYVKANPDVAALRTRAPRASYIAFDNSADALAALKAGKGDVFTQVVTHLYRAASQDAAYTVVGRFTSKSYAVVYRKGDRALGSYLNEWLHTIRANGEYDRLYQKWFFPYGGAALLPLAASASASAAALPAYRPQPVQPAPDASYILPDGSIRVVGTEYVQTIVGELDALFVKTHPGLRFTPQLRGTGTAIPALTHGVTLFAPMGREADELELVPYKKIVGAAPLELRVAHASNTSPTLPTSLALYVNKANPIERLTLDQVARIFGSGHEQGDITRWGQLGLPGEWSGRAIHPFGTPETGGFGSHMKRHVLHGASFSPAYEAEANTKAILRRVALDGAGIGFAAIGNVSPQLKMVAVSDDVGAYPFGRYLYFSLRRTPGKPVDPLVREYMRMVLSQEGQAIVSAGADGFLPLDAQEVAEQLARLDQAAPAGSAKP